MAYFRFRAGPLGAAAPPAGRRGVTRWQVNGHGGAQELVKRGLTCAC